MKKCPFCAEEILDGAIKCKHCNEWLDRSDTKELSVNGNVTKKGFSFLKYFLVWASILSISITLVFWGISDSKVDDISDIIFGSIIFSLLLSVIVTYIHKWIFESKNPKQVTGEENKANKPLHFGAFDWAILIGATVMLSFSIIGIVGDGLILFVSGQLENYTQFLATIFWVAISTAALLMKLKKYKGAKTSKSYKTTIVVLCLIFGVIVVPTTFSIFSSFFKAKSTSSVSPEQQKVVDGLLLKTKDFQMTNEKVKLSTFALSNAEDDAEYSKKSSELLLYAKDLQIHLDGIQSFLQDNSSVFEEPSDQEAFQAVKDVFVFRSKHNKKLIELAELGSKLNVNNETQLTKAIKLDKLNKLADELEAIEAQLPAVESKFLEAFEKLDPELKDQMQQQMQQKREQNQKLLEGVGQ